MTGVHPLTKLPLFPFEGDLQIKQLSQRLDDELAREGEGSRPCKQCNNLDDVIWANDRWVVRAGQPSACPVVVFLETRAHLNLDDLDEAYAAELGVLTWQLEAAIRAVADVGRVHVHRWGDGSSHFHVWFVARPAGQVEFYGWGTILWSQVLPAQDRRVLNVNLDLVARTLHELRNDPAPRRSVYRLTVGSFSSPSLPVPVGCTIRPATIDDTETLGRLMECAYEGTIDDSLGDNTDGVVEVHSWLDEGGDPTASNIAVDTNGQLRAAALMTSGEQWWVSYVITRPDSKGSGLGRAVTLSSIAAAAERGAVEIFAGVTDGNVASTRLLRSAGFERIDLLDS
jgi:GNAT superfamily N-acetyltransferase